MKGYKDVGNTITKVVFAVIFVIIAIIATVILVDTVADQGPALQGASNNTTNALTEGDWGSESANGLADSVGTVTPMAFVAMFIGLVFAPIGGAVALAYSAYKDIRD